MATSFLENSLAVNPSVTYINKTIRTTNAQSTTLPPRRTKLLKLTYLLLGVLLLVPVVVYCSTIYENAYNFPYEDDFNSALSFIADFAFNHTAFADRLQLLFAQYNEHRIVFDRLVFLGDYYLFGSLNFRYLILVGNLAVLLLAFLFVRLSFRQYVWSQRLLYLLPVAYSLFLFQYWELTTWSMAALSNFYTIVFALVSLSLVTKPGNYAFVFACVAASLATFTLGSGVFCFVTGIPLLILAKSYRRLMIWLAVTVGNVLLYFQDYYRPPYHPKVVDTLLNHTSQTVRYFFSLLGTFFPSRPTVSLLFGMVMLLTAVFIIVYRWHTRRLTENLPLLGLLLFLYLTCLSITAGRAGFGVQQAYSTRYGFVIVTLYATQVVLLIETIRTRYVQTGVAVACGALSILVFVSGTNSHNRRNIEQRSAKLEQVVRQYKQNPATTRLPWGEAQRAKAIFSDALTKGIYQLDKASD